jgi:prepilin-type processing-associated H-X9-DG protein
LRFNYLFCDGHIETRHYLDFVTADWRYNY